MIPVFSSYTLIIFHLAYSKCTKEKVRLWLVDLQGVFCSGEGGTQEMGPHQRGRCQGPGGWGSVSGEGMCQGRESPTAEGVMVGTPEGGLESFTKLPQKRDFKEVSKTGTPRAHSSSGLLCQHLKAV